MAPWLFSSLVGTALLGSTVVGVGWMMAQGQQTTPTMKPPGDSCTNPPRWSVIYSSSDGAVRPEEKGWWMTGESIVGTQVCQNGTLQIVAEGEVAKGFPEVIVTLDGQSLAQTPVALRKAFQVSIPHGGNLQVMYLNDFYESEVRLAILRTFRMNAGSCRKLTKINLPQENGGGYSPAAGILTLVGSAPATIKPCTPGTLSFVMEGKVAQGKYPQIRIMQDGKVLKALTTSSEKRQVTVQVSGSPLQLQLINPYAKELLDRNLRLVSLSWEP